MNKYSTILALLLITSPTLAKDELTTIWKVKVTNSKNEQEYIPNRAGGNVPMTTCRQKAIFRARNGGNDLQEFLQIDCKIGINGSTSIIQSCYVDKHDSSWSAITVNDSVFEFSIQVSCLTL